MQRRDVRPEIASAGRYALAREICPGQRVLDLGCGSGEGAVLLAGWGAGSVTAVDLVEPVGAATLGEAVSFQRGDACAEDGLDRLGPFDLVLALGLVEEVDEAPALLSTVRRRLAPGGVAIVTCPVGEEGPQASARAFSRLASDILGKPSQVLFALPVSGLLMVDPERLRPGGPNGIVDQEDIYGTVRLGGGPGSLAATWTIAGIWGGEVPDACVVAPEAPSAPPGPATRPGPLGRLLRVRPWRLRRRGA